MLAAVALFCVLTAGVVLESRPVGDRGTTNQEAYDLYLLGRTIWMKRDSARMPQSFNYLRQAVDKDPRFAQAWAALADWHAFEVSPALEARKAAEWALVLNPKLAEPHATMGFISMIHDWDWLAAERHFRKSLQMNPKYPTGRQWFALYLTLSRRFGEAEANLREGLQQDPLSLNLLHQRCVLLYHSKQYAAAERECSKVLEIDPVFRFSRETLIRIHARLGNFSWIVDHIGGDTASRDYRAPADSPSRLAFQKDGPAGMWRVLAEQTRASGENYLGLAGYYTELGETDHAIESLARAVEAHEFRMVYACSDPVFDPLRGDPRFRKVLEKVCGSQPGD
jgi:tetratricopeptide (TPR) repeat protein